MILEVYPGKLLTFKRKCDNIYVNFTLTTIDGRFKQELQLVLLLDQYDFSAIYPNSLDLRIGRKMIKVGDKINTNNIEICNQNVFVKDKYLSDLLTNCDEIRNLSHFQKRTYFKEKITTDYKKIKFFPNYESFKKAFYITDTSGEYKRNIKGKIILDKMKLNLAVAEYEIYIKQLNEPKENKIVDTPIQIHEYIPLVIDACLFPSDSYTPDVWETIKFDTKLCYNLWDALLYKYKILAVNHIPQMNIIIDETKGIPYDNKGNPSMFRYIKNDKVYMKRIGKIFTEQALLFCEKYNYQHFKPIITYLSEEITKSWITERCKDNFNIVIDKDFKFIYTSSNYASDINSCMNDKEFYVFYNNINASAVSLRNTNNKILARCILFNDVESETNGNKYRYLERIYFTDIIFANILLNKLIDDKLIDIYKVVGVGARDETKIHTVEGEYLNEFICLNINIKNINGPIPYMDTFKYNNTWYLTNEYNEDPPLTMINGLNPYIPLICNSCGCTIDCLDEDACVVDGQPYCSDCTVYDEINEEYILGNNAIVFFDSCGSEYFTKESEIDNNVVYVKSKSSYYLKSLCVLINDEYKLIIDKPK